jgi:hypothetical protein
VARGGSRRRSGGKRKGGAKRGLTRSARARLSKAVKEGIDKSPFKRRRRGDTGAADQEHHRRERQEEAGKPKKRQSQISDLKKGGQNIDKMLESAPSVKTPHTPPPSTGAGQGHTGGPHDPVTTGFMVIAAIVLGAKRKFGNRGKG